MYSHARWELRRWFMSLLLCPLLPVWCLLSAVNSLLHLLILRKLSRPRPVSDWTLKLLCLPCYYDNETKWRWIPLITFLSFEGDEYLSSLFFRLRAMNTSHHFSFVWGRWIPLITFLSFEGDEYLSSFFFHLRVMNTSHHFSFVWGWWIPFITFLSFEGISW